MSQIPITRAGYEKLKKDLEQLKNVAVPENIREIEEARSHGDISENAEYEAAKERQAFIQGKIQETENNLANCVVIDPKDMTADRAAFGSSVTIEDMETGDVTTYQLVGPLESDVRQKKISVTSPIGKALIGKKVGDTVTVKTPGGVRDLEVIDITVEF